MARYCVGDVAGDVELILFGTDAWNRRDVEAVIALMDQGQADQTGDSTPDR
jgi:hypothetical protein